MNYADARIEFQRATKALIPALRYGLNFREALKRYALAERQLRVAPS
jgi:hypothetical protein